MPIDTNGLSRLMESLEKNYQLVSTIVAIFVGVGTVVDPGNPAEGGAKIVGGLVVGFAALLVLGCYLGNWESTLGKIIGVAIGSVGIGTGIFFLTAVYLAFPLVANSHGAAPSGFAKELMNGLVWGGYGSLILGLATMRLWRSSDGIGLGLCLCVFGVVSPVAAFWMLSNY